MVLWGKKGKGKKKVERMIEGEKDIELEKI